jgi:hypothetical protein
MIAAAFDERKAVKVARNLPIQEPTGARDCALQLINS